MSVERNAMMKNMSIRTRILVGVVAVNLIGIIVVMIYLHQSYSGGLDVSAEKSLSLSTVSWANIQELETQKLTAALDGLMANTEYQRLVAANDRAGLAKATQPLFETLKSGSDITHWYFETKDSKVFLRVHKPEQFDDAIERSTFLKAKESESAAAGLDLGKNAIALRVVAPYKSASGADLGFMETGQEVESFLERMKKETGADYALLLSKDTMDSEEYGTYRESLDLPNNWDERENYVLAGATSDAVAENATFEVAPGDVPETGKLIGIENGACSKTCHSGVAGDGDYWTVRWSNDSNSRAHVVFPVTDVNGAPVGVVYAVEDISKAADSAGDSLTRTLIVIVIGLVLATIMIAWMLERFVFSRLTRMITSMEDISMRVAGGDFEAHFTADGTTDEIGHFESFFAKFLDLMTGTLKMFTKQ